MTLRSFSFRHLTLALIVSAAVCSGQVFPGGGNTVPDGGLNGGVYRDASGALHGTQTGGTGTLCFISTNGGTPVFGSCSGSAATAWSSVTAPSSNLAVTMSAYTTVWTYDAATGSSTMQLVTDTTSNTGTGILWRTTTASGSTETPWQADANGNGWKISTSGLLTPVGTGSIVAPFIELLGSSTGYDKITSPLSGTTNYTIALPAHSANDTFCLLTAANCGGGGTSIGGTVTSGNPNNLLYVGTGPVLAQIAAVDSAVVVTNPSGVPSESTTLPSGLTIPGYAPTASPTFTGTVTVPYLDILGSSTGYDRVTSPLSGTTNYTIALPAHTANDTFCLETAANCGGGLSIGGTVTSGNPNDLFYVGTGPVLAQIAAVDSAVVVTNPSGVPSESTTLPSGLTIPGYAPTASPTFTGTVTVPYLDILGSSTGYDRFTSPLSGSTSYSIALPAHTANDTLCFQTVGNCTASGSLGGVNTQSGNYTALSGDTGRTIVMTGSSATLTLPSTPPSADWTIWAENQSSTNQTIALNGLLYNGGSTNLTLYPFQRVKIETDGTNYKGDVPILPGNGMQYGTAANGNTIQPVSTYWSSVTSLLQGDITTAFSATGTSSYVASPVVGCATAVLKIGMVVWLDVDTTNASGLASFTYCTFGSIAIKPYTGSSNAPANIIPTFTPFPISYDGTYWRLPAWMTPASLIASGIVDGEAPVTITTAASATLGGTYSSGYTFNQDATAAAAITYTLPTAAAGKQYCVGNSYNGSAATTGTIELLTSASGQYIIFTDGTLSASGGYVISGGAARDSACVVGTDSTHWTLYVQSGTWTKH